MAQVTQTTAQIQAILNNAIPNPMTDVGDLVVGVTDDLPGRVPKGTSGAVLTVNSAGTGIEWQGSGDTALMLVEVEVHGDFSRFVDPTITPADLYNAAMSGAKVVIQDEWHTQCPLQWCYTDSVSDPTATKYFFEFSLAYPGGFIAFQIEGSDTPESAMITYADSPWEEH